MLLCHLITHTKKKNIKAVNLFFLEKKNSVYIYIYMTELHLRDSLP